MPFAKEHSARLRNPADFNPKTFRRKKGGTILGKIKVPTTIAVIWGKITGKDKPADNVVAQGLRFPTANWTESEAKKWIADNGVNAILFEAASGKAKAIAATADKEQLILDGVDVSVDIEAAGEDRDGKPRIPRLAIKAYTGEPMQVAWGDPVVLDMDGIGMPTGQIPVRLNHDETTPVGHLESVQQKEGALWAYGVLSFAGEPYADRIVKAAKNGFKWQASVSVRATRVEYIKPEGHVTVNGRSYDGPIYLVRSGMLREISIVDLGADSYTSAKIAAKAAQQEKQTMAKAKAKKTVDPDLVIEDPNLELEDDDQYGQVDAADSPVKARPKTKKIDAGSRDVDSIIAEAKAKRERSRQMAAITEDAASIDGADLEAIDDISAQAVAEGWAVKDLELALLRLTRPKVSNRRTADPLPQANVLEAAALTAMGYGGDPLVRTHGEQTVDLAEKTYGRTIGLQELVLACAQANGYRGRLRISTGNWKEVLAWAAPGVRDLQAAAGFSTVDLSGILGNVANKALAAVASEPQWLTPLVAGVASHSNFHSHTVYSMAMNGELEEVGPTGELKHLDFSEESWTRQVKTRGAVIRLSRTDVINDDLGVFARNANGLARKAYTTREKAMFTAIMATGDGASHFTAARGNYLTGAGTALGAAGLANAIKAFRNMTGPDGDPIMVEPAVMLLPPTLEDEGRRLLAAGSNVVMYGAGTSKVIGSSYRGERLKAIKIMTSRGR